MLPWLRKLALAVHLTVSVGWIGAVIAYLALGMKAANAADDLTVRSAWSAMETVGWYVIVRWRWLHGSPAWSWRWGHVGGLLRHYW